MVRKTYNNILKAGKMIEKKGYTEKEALDMALKIFDTLEQNKISKCNVGWTAERYIDYIVIKYESGLL